MRQMLLTRGWQGSPPSSALVRCLSGSQAAQWLLWQVWHLLRPGPGVSGHSSWVPSGQRPTGQENRQKARFEAGRASSAGWGSCIQSPWQGEGGGCWDWTGRPLPRQALGCPCPLGHVTSELSGLVAGLGVGTGPGGGRKHGGESGPKAGRGAHPMSTCVPRQPVNLSPPGRLSIHKTEDSTTSQGL